MNVIALLLYALVAIGIYGVSALCFIAGFFFGRSRQTDKPDKTKSTTAKSVDTETLRRAKRMQKEVTNMLSYTGDPQEEIHID